MELDTPTVPTAREHVQLADHHFILNLQMIEALH